MTQGTVGWLCPKCGAVISPYETACAKCSPTRYYGLGSLSGWSGTITLGNSSPMYHFTSGTVFANPRSEAKPDPKDAKLKEWRDWRDRVVELRDELDELIEEVEDME